MPRFETRPKVVRSPTTPFSEPGMRTEPPVSVPSETGTSSAATAAPEPPLEPPGMRERSQGLRQGPVCSFCEVAPKASSCMVSLPTSTAPAACRRRVTSASSAGTRSRKNPAPAVVTMPAVSMLSFSPTGSPCSGPSERPSAYAASAAAACSRASAAVTVTKAPTSPSTCSIRARLASTSSVAVTSPAASRSISVITPPSPTP